MKLSFAIGVLFWCSTLVSFRVDAQIYRSKDSTLVNPRAYISLGAYFPSVSTELRIDGDVIGTDISLEEDLRLLDDMSVFKADALFRAGQRSQFLISFTSLLRRNDFEINESITVNDTVFDVGANLDIFFDTYYYALTWRYSLFNEVNWNAGFSVGVRYVYFDTGLEARFNDEITTVQESIGAPALLLGLHGGGYLTSRLLARYSLEYLRLTVADIGIRIVESDFSLEYFIGRHWGLGVAYSTNSYLVKDIPFSDFDGKVSFAFGGLNLFATARF
jgi:hypothetical protein